uniref:SH2 domain-containing protein n=1 Tax=Latimeria chalumnae TaxID=7897 RepID=H3A0F1_LATCH
LSSFNSLSISTPPSYYRQIQKMVHDIKKNDGGIMNKIKKFQNEQLAVIRKTGKNTWDRIKNKPPPSPPIRDYASGSHDDHEEDQWSDDFDSSDYENPDEHSNSETYVDPNEEHFEEYEPPPTEQEARKIAPAFRISKGEYAENLYNKRQPALPSKPLLSKPSQPPTMSKNPPPLSIMQKHNQKASLIINSYSNTLHKPGCNIPPPKKNQTNMYYYSPLSSPTGHFVFKDEYIVPVDDDQDNYIDPTEGSLPSKPPVINRLSKPSQAPSSPTSYKPATIPNADVYEVVSEEESPSPPTNDKRKNMKINTIRLSKKADQKEEQNSEEEYEVCDPSCSVSDTNKSCQELPLPATPVPLSRPGENGIGPRLVKLGLDKPAIPDRHKISNKVPELPPPIPASINLIKPPELPTRPTGTLRNAISSSSSNADKEAGVYNKAWYASFCDRKTAEEALQKSHKDGSFLIRKSSGQDSKQPYTLAVFYKKRVYNIPVRYIESTKQYALGREKNGEERFHSVAEIIENHQQNPLVLIDSQNNTKDSTKLKYAVQVS